MTRLGLVVALATVLVASVVQIAMGGGNDGPTRIHVLRLTVDSNATGEKNLPLRVIIPPGRGPKPLVVFLHGRGQSPDALLNAAFFDAYEALGRRAPIVAMPYGDDHSYWHNRKDGRWADYVTDEVIPRVQDETPVDADRLGVAGISMGGFGALDIAAADDGEFCAVGAHSPALWRTSGETAPGAFDDAADFGRHDVVARASQLAGTRVWLDAGTRDPFLPGDRAFVDRLEGGGGEPTVHYWSGGHDTGYWDRHWRNYLGFYARALKDCG